MATTLQNIIDLTRMRSNQENSQFVTDAELIIYINNSLAELDGLLATEYEDYRVSNFLASIPSDGVSNTISISSNVFKIRGVDFQTNTAGPSNWYTLKPFQFTKRNRLNNSFANMGWSSGSLSYRIMGSVIIIAPQAQAAGSYQVWYTPKFNNLVNLTDQLNIQMDTQAWVEYAVVDCCIKILNKQNLDPSGFMAEKAALRARILAEGKNRDAGGPKSVANVRDDDDFFGLGYGRY